MLISTLARLVGCSERAIRHYHQIGLLAEPQRLSNGYRDYQISDLNRVLTIRALINAGIPLAEIGTEIDFATALSRIDAKIATLEQQRNNLLRLAETPLGVPANLLTAIEKHLLNCDFPAILIAHELESFQLMGICGAATEATWAQLAANLKDPAVAESTHAQAELWHKVAALSPESEEFEQFITQIAQLLPTGLMARLHPTLREADMPLTGAEFQLPYPYDYAFHFLTFLMQP